MSEGRESKTTPAIVGGQPIGRLEGAPEISAGVEAFLLKASLDPEFRSRLGRNREEAIAGAGLELTDLERAILRAVPDPLLSQMIDQFKPARFKGKRALRAAVSLAALVSVSALSPSQGNKEAAADSLNTEAQITEIRNLDPKVAEKAARQMRGFDRRSDYGSSRGIRPRDTPTPSDTTPLPDPPVSLTPVPLGIRPTEEPISHTPAPTTICPTNTPPPPKAPAPRVRRQFIRGLERNREPLRERHRPTRPRDHVEEK